MNRNSLIFSIVIFQIFFLVFSTTESKAKSGNENYLIPKPNFIKFGQGYFKIDKKTKIVYDESFKELAGYLSSQIKNSFSVNIPVSNASDNQNIIELRKLESTDKSEKELYKISIDKKRVTISSYSVEGIFRGIHTILQLFPLNTKSFSLSLPCCEIEDKPSFSWRGLNLDCGRHFMSKDFIKRYIDILAHYKFNKFHWHLTEDQGWRIEIKKYPKLTSVGAWRKEADGSIYGGFYTQEDIKEIVTYAKSRYIDVIPEIEMPGHSTASLASYPENSCTGGPFEVANTWGVFKDVYCAGKDSSFLFLQNVLDEVISLFPYEYIHIGGDECPKDRWKSCSKCQQRIKDEKLKDEFELQTYFITRIAKYLESKGKKIIGWEEILEGGLTEGATVQSWTGFDGAIKAAKKKHNSICSPASHTYLNADPNDLELRVCYSFNPIPTELNNEEAKYIIGGEANLWTEHAPQETVDSKLFPRILALSEVFWTDKKNNNYDEFYPRLQKHYQHLINNNIGYGREGKAITHLIDFNKEKKLFKVTLKAEEKDIVIRYTLNGDTPDHKSTLYTKPIIITKNTALKIAGFKFNKSIMKPLSLEFNTHKALGAIISLKYPYNEKYRAGGDNALVDGTHGTTDLRSGGWQGFEGTDMEAVIDLGKEIEISKISLSCLQDAASWIFFPVYVDFKISNDNTNFTDKGQIVNDYPQKSGQPIIKSFTQSFEKTKCRYIKVLAKGIITCPDWHPGAGGKAWIFTDEVVVE